MFHGSMHQEYVGWGYGQRWSKTFSGCALCLEPTSPIGDVQTGIFEAI